MKLKTRGEGIKNPIILWTSYVHCPQGRENSIEAPLDWMPYQLGIGMGNWPGKLQGAHEYLCTAGSRLQITQPSTSKTAPQSAWRWKNRRPPSRPHPGQVNRTLVRNINPRRCFWLPTLEASKCAGNEEKERNFLTRPHISS